MGVLVDDFTTMGAAVEAEKMEVCAGRKDGSALKTKLALKRDDEEVESKQRKAEHAEEA